MPPSVTEDTLTSEGGVNSKQLTNLPLSNWALVNGSTGGTSIPPHSQTGPVNTCIAAIVLVPFFTGIFEVGYRVTFSDGTTAGLTQTFLKTKVGGAAGALAGGNAQVRLGLGAASVAQAVGATANGMVLNVDGAGGGGLTFEAGAVNTGAIEQMEDSGASLTGLLTANASGCMHSSGFTIVDNVGDTGNAKTPFATGLSTARPVCFALLQSATAAHVITYQTIHLFVREIPVP